MGTNSEQQNDEKEKRSANEKKKNFGMDVKSE